MSDIFEEMRKWTEARIGLKRSGVALSTSEVLNFKLAHAQARDSVHAKWDYHLLHQKLAQRGIPSFILRSKVESRNDYLKRPDLGRALHSSSLSILKDILKDIPATKNPNLIFVVSDGLSATAIENHFLPFWDIFEPMLMQQKIEFAPLFLVPYSRIAIADELGAVLQAKTSVVFIGERPGLTSADSMGAYLTYHPRVGKQDSQRNCISNIRPPGGLTYSQANATLIFLLKECLRLQISGVQLKDESALS
jgi:ethanolamine ammonia-lyase small subunit